MYYDFPKFQNIYCKTANEAVSFARVVREKGLKARAIDTVAAGTHKAGDCRYIVRIYNPGLNAIEFERTIKALSGQTFATR